MKTTKFTIKINKLTQFIFILCLFIFFQKSHCQSLTLPSVGFNINGVSNTGKAITYKDLVKSMRWLNVASWDSLGYPTSADSGTFAVGKTAVGTGAFYPKGKYVLVWEGSGTVKVSLPRGGTLLEENLSGKIKRRVYDLNPDKAGVQITIESYPATNIHLYLPGTENYPSMFNPDYLAYLEPFREGVFRSLDFMRINGSPQKYWDQRMPLNWSSYVEPKDNCAPWSVYSSGSWEAFIQLSNELNSDMWINIPHLATNNYIEQLAKLIKNNLNYNLKVWVEYSNEVWNFNFSQTHWVQDSVEGENLDVKYANKAIDVFNIFRSAFENDQRVIRVLATQGEFGTGQHTRTYKRIHAAGVDNFDVVALATYFSYDGKQYIYDNWPLSNEKLWEHLDSCFIDTIPFGENEKFYWSYKAALDAGVPIVAYEGSNEHLNPVGKIDTDGDGTSDTPLCNAIPESVDFIHNFARSPYMAQLQEKNQIKHEKSGLSTQSIFTFMGKWSKYGQWGFVEYNGQPVDSAVKYKWALDHYNLDYPIIEDSIVPKYYLEVLNGVGSGAYHAGDEIVISADSILSGKYFVSWHGGGEFIEDSLSLITSIIVPDSNITVEAIYKTKDVKHKLTIYRGMGTGEYYEGLVVDIKSDLPQEDSIFYYWSGGDSFILDSLKSSTSIIMPSKDLNVIANYKQIIPQLCSVEFRISDGTNAIIGAEIDFNNNIMYSGTLGDAVFSNVEIGSHQDFSIKYQGIVQRSGTLDIYNDTLVNYIINPMNTFHRAFNGVTVFPNPAHEKIYVSNNLSQDVLVKIMDLSGKLLKSEKISGKNLTIDISSIQSGYYILHLITEQNLKDFLIKIE